MARIHEEILQFINEGVGDFESLALKVFVYQFRANPNYRTLCEQQGVTPAHVKEWREIPAVPALAFKWMDVVCEPVERAQRVFISSGTTQGTQRSRHYVFNLKLYDAAIQSSFPKYLLKDKARMPVFLLAPPAEQALESSLAYMLDFIKQEFGARCSEHFVTQSEEASFEHSVSVSSCGEETGQPSLRRSKLECDRLTKRLSNVNEPVMLLGTSLAFLHLLDYCTAHSLSFNLPQGSRLMDTGGLKGVSREISREELYRRFDEVLGIPPEYCVNEYGMSEMCSQFYDHIAGERVRARVYRPAHWVRTLVIDPSTMREAESGTEGILRHFDLANLGSAMVIQTEDVGRVSGDGFLLLGRAAGAESRGCSIGIEEMLNSRK